MTCGPVLEPAYQTQAPDYLQAGELLRTEGFEFDFAFCSVLKRSIKTLSLILEELDQLWVPVEKSWRLNERHYGDLQEVSKAETAKKFGTKQLQEWRRGYDSAPARKLSCLALPCLLGVQHTWD